MDTTPYNCNPASEVYCFDKTLKAIPSAVLRASSWACLSFSNASCFSIASRLAIASSEYSSGKIIPEKVVRNSILRKNIAHVLIKIPIRDSFFRFVYE